MSDSPIVKPGFPEGHPMHNHGLDPQRVDDSGVPVIHLKPWSQCSTGIWLNVLVSTTSPVRLDCPWKGRNLRLSDHEDVWLHVSTSKGKPTATNPTYGSCLELPSDLGDDDLKQTYVTDWIIATVKEALVLSGNSPRLTVASRWEMIDAVEDAIRGQNL